MTEAGEPPPPVGEEAGGGEPACLLHRVCDGCGALLEDPRAPCWRCGRTA